MSKEELTNKYYKQDLCDSESSCKLYNPLLTQGECYYYNEWCELKDKIADLESKLAEKEKAYDLKYKHWIEEIRESDRLREELAKTNKEWVQSIHDWKELCKKKDQDKISFAVEQLEKVKELLLIESKEYPIVYEISDDIVGGAIDKDKCFKIIDNQIRQLKEMPNEK